MNAGGAAAGTGLFALCGILLGLLLFSLILLIFLVLLIFRRFRFFLLLLFFLRRGRRRFFFSKRMAVKRSGLIFGDSQRAGKRHADNQCDADDQC